MRKTKKIKVQVTETKTLDILCNMCGKTCNNYKRKNPKAKHQIQEYSGLIETEIHGGYDSNIIGDMVSWRFSICEPCLATKVVAHFKIPYQVKDHQLSNDYESIESLNKKSEKRELQNRAEFIRLILKSKAHKKKDLIKLDSRELYDLYWSLTPKE